MNYMGSKGEDFKIMVPFEDVGFLGFSKFSRTWVQLG